MHSGLEKADRRNRKDYLIWATYPYTAIMNSCVIDLATTPTAPIMKPPALTPGNLKRMQCLGLWRTHYRLNDGKEYKMSLVPPLGIPTLYFVSRRPITKHYGSVLSFAVHHHDCLGLAYTSKYLPEPHQQFSPRQRTLRV